MEENWWPIYRISFTKGQMWWLIEHLEELRNGDWPGKPSKYVDKPKQACKEARDGSYWGLCINCPFVPCLNPKERTPNRIRKERNLNRVLEIAAEVDVRLGMVMGYISGWERPEREVMREGNGNRKGKGRIRV